MPFRSCRLLVLVTTLAIATQEVPVSLVALSKHLIRARRHDSGLLGKRRKNVLWKGLEKMSCARDNVGPKQQAILQRRGKVYGYD